MITHRLVLLASAALLTSAGTVSAHLHFTINTNPVVPQGNQIGIETYDDDAPDLHGNYAQFPNAAGELTLMDGTPLTITLNTLVPAGQSYAGFLAGEAPTLTTDLYVDNGSGHLSGGDFWYEIHSLSPVAGVGGSPSAHLVWTIPANADENPTINPAEVAVAGAPTREGRSLDLGYDEHLHGETLFVDEPGLYNVGLIGWDKNGLYLDSPLTSFRVYAPIPGDTNLDGKVDFADLVNLARNYGASSGETWQTGDFYGTGAVTFDDLVILARHYGQSLGATAAPAIVPEPASLGALLLAGAVLARRRRHTVSFGSRRRLAADSPIARGSMYRIGTTLVSTGDPYNDPMNAFGWQA